MKKKLTLLSIIVASFFINIDNAKANEDDYWGEKSLVIKRFEYDNPDGPGTLVLHQYVTDCIGWGLCNGLFGA